MNGKPYVVTIVGKISVDTTVAVIAESEEEAERIQYADQKHLLGPRPQ